jgi:hypothetical protein
MNRLKGLLGALLIGATSGVAHAEIFDLSVGDNSFRAALYGPLSRIASQSEGQYDVGVIVRPKREDDLLIVHAGALLTGDTGMRNFELAAGLGVRGVYIGRDRDSGGAVAPGGQLEARFPGYERIGFSIYGYYAPEVLSLGEFDEYYEVGVGVDYQVLKNASVYLGYRNVNVEIEDGPKLTADNGLHVGLRLEF